jgi:2-dehydropantoate 2-reductase
MAQEVNQGLSVSDWKGRQQAAPAEYWEYSVEDRPLAEADVILVTVKGLATQSAAESIKRYAKPDTPVVSFQNGLSNAELLGEALSQPIFAGMVPFNVAYQGNGLFHSGTEGNLAMDSGAKPYGEILAAFGAAQLPVDLYDDMNAVLWGKLLLNLNNPINALSGLPLKQQLETRGYRKILAASIREALNALNVAGITPAKMSKVSPKLLPILLSLPNPIFRSLAKAMLKIDPKATSSMADDLGKGRFTEIDFLSGEVIKLAEKYGLFAPTNLAISAAIKEAESKTAGSPKLSAAQLQVMVNAVKQ